jgi:hypothetical protein
VDSRLVSQQEQEQEQQQEEQAQAQAVKDRQEHGRGALAGCEPNGAECAGKKERPGALERGSEQRGPFCTRRRSAAAYSVDRVACTW